MIWVNYEKIEEIKNKERDLENKKYSDAEIISFIRNQITNNDKEYTEGRAYRQNHEFYGWTDIKKPSLKSIENEIIKKHLRENGAGLNINLYFDLFNEIGLDKCKQIVLGFLENSIIVERLTDEQVISIYQSFPDECRTWREFKPLSNRIRQLILENKFQKILNKNDEIIKFISENDDSFLNSDDVNSNLIITSDDLKYIINSLYPVCRKGYFYEDLCQQDMCRNFNELLDHRKEIVDDNVKRLLFNKLQVLTDADFMVVICPYIYYFDRVLKFNFTNSLDEEQLNNICRRLYRISKTSDIPGTTKFSKQYDFISYFKSEWHSYSKMSQEKTLTDEIIDEMIMLLYSKKEYERVIELRMKMIYNLTGNKKGVFSKESLKKIFAEMCNSDFFFYHILNISPAEFNYKFDFIKNNIIDEVGEGEILKLLDKYLSSAHVKDAFNIAENIVKNLKDKDENQELINKILNDIFEKLYKHPQNEILFKYLDVDLFKYLNEENKNKLLRFIAKENRVNADALAHIIVSGHINIAQFTHFWQCLLSEENNSLKRLIINSLFKNNEYNKLDESFRSVLVEYINDNKLDYVRFVLNFDIRDWTDLEVSYICEVESLDNIGTYLQSTYRFTKKQLNILFRHFYKMDSCPFAPDPDGSGSAYLEFNEGYKKITNGKTYSDGNLELEEREKINSLVLNIKRKIKEAKDTDGLPF